MTNEEVIIHLEFLKIAKQVGAIPNDINVEALNIAIKALKEIDDIKEAYRIMRGDI